MVEAECQPQAQPTKPHEEQQVQYQVSNQTGVKASSLCLVVICSDDAFTALAVGASTAATSMAVSIHSVECR